MLTLGKAANLLISEAKKRADYDEPLFESPDLKSPLVRLTEASLKRPEALIKAAGKNHSITAVLNEVIVKGLWGDTQLEPLATRMLTHPNESVRGLFVHCLLNQSIMRGFSVREKLYSSPAIVDNLLKAAESSESSDFVRKLIKIIGRPADVAKLDSAVNNFSSRLISQIARHPHSDILADAACFFANHPKPAFSKLLHEKLATLNGPDLSYNDQSILRYLINHSPDSAVVSTAIKTGLDYRSSFDNYPGKTGLLEAALYLKKNKLSLNIRLLGLGNLFDIVTNRELGPRNFSDKAAMRYIRNTLRSAQFDEELSVALGALGKSSHPAALAYLEKNLKPMNLFQKLLYGLELSYSNMSENFARKSIALAALRGNPDPRAQALVQLAAS